MERLDTARAYFDGFSRSDHEAILSLLTEDVVWVVHGHRRLEGKEAFDSEIEAEGFDGPPQLDVDRWLETGDAVIVPHTGVVQTSGGDPFRFAACDILTFRDDLIARVESWVVPVAD